jgi:hypothetical protein
MLDSCGDWRYRRGAHRRIRAEDSYANSPSILLPGIALSGTRLSSHPYSKSAWKGDSRKYVSTEFSKSINRRAPMAARLRRPSLTREHSRELPKRRGRSAAARRERDKPTRTRPEGFPLLHRPSRRQLTKQPHLPSANPRPATPTLPPRPRELPRTAKLDPTNSLQRGTTSKAVVTTG